MRYLILFLALQCLSNVAHSKMNTDHIRCTDGFNANQSLQYDDCVRVRERLQSNTPTPEFLNNQNSDLLTALTEVKKSVRGLEGSGDITVMTFNIGAADFKLTFKNLHPALKPYCDNLKLCREKLANQVKQVIQEQKPDVIFLQEVNGYDQLFSNSNFGPLLNTSSDSVNYEGSCSLGHLGVDETCLVWNRNKFKLVEACKALVQLQGTAMRCNLEIQGQKIQFVNVHPSAWKKVERRFVLRTMWSKLIDREMPAVIAGDFNTHGGTLGFGNKEVPPYPPEFGTVFGQHPVNYGRTPAQEKNFFGHYHGEKPVKHSSTTMGTKLDNIFTNFGQTKNFESDSKCPFSSCVGGKDKGFLFDNPRFRFDYTFLWAMDHRPIIARIIW